jgi:hypothetical protein
MKSALADFSWLRPNAHVGIKPARLSKKFSTREPALFPSPGVDASNNPAQEQGLKRLTNAEICVKLFSSSSFSD